MAAGPPGEPGIQGLAGQAGTDVQLPPGTMVAFGGAVAPPGWLPCEGQAVSRTAHAGLFAALGTRWGEGDGTSTFNVPDLRGRFVRGVDLGTQRDPDAATRVASQPGGSAGDAVGSLQAGQLQSHNHSITNVHTMSYTAGGSTNGLRGDDIGFPMYPGSIYAISPTGGSETRPVNVAVSWMIKTDG